MIRIALLVAALLSTTGCGPRALVEHDGLGFDERRARLTAIPAWEMRGRIAVDTGERGFPATFRWRQEGERSTLVIRGPFGAGAVEVTGSPERMIVRARGEQHVLEDPETDLSALLGSGRARPGDRIALPMAGFGLNWQCAVLEVVAR